MKKSLLLVAAMFICAAGAIAQNNGTPLSTITYTSQNADFSGKTFTPLSPFTVAQGGAILVANSSYTGTDYWDLGTYNGIEVKLTTDVANVGQYMAVRFVMVSDAGAQSIVKSFTFTGTTQVVKLDFAADAAATKKLWAIKMPWDGSITGSFLITIDYLNAVTFFTGLSDINTLSDPNELIKVYDITGRLIHNNVKRGEVMGQLENGLYIVNNKKVFINK